MIGAVVFGILRPYIDINAHGPVESNSHDVSEHIEELAGKLGFSMDTLASASLFQQHGSYIQTIRDSLPDAPSLSELNKRDAHLQSWATIIAPKGTLNAMVVDINQAFGAAGYLGIRTSNQGRIIRLTTNPNKTNPIFIQADSLERAATFVVEQAFGYDLSKYTMDKDKADSLSEDPIIIMDDKVARSSSGDNGKSIYELTFNWVRADNDERIPAKLSLVMEPVVKEIENNGAVSTEFGYMVNSFIASNPLEPETLGVSFEDEFELFTYILIASAIVLAIVVIAVGIQNIFKGKVEWRRALMMFFIFALTYFGWRMIFYWDVYGELLSQSASLITALNNLLVGLAIGLYGAMAYISWETFARYQKTGEIALVDAFWQRKFFIREAGASLITGFFAAGILLGVFALLLFALDSFFLQSESQFGLTEPAIEARLLTINMTTWSTVWLIGFGQVGFVIGFLRHWIKNEVIANILSILVIGMLLTVLGRMVATPLGLGTDILIFVILSLIILWLYQNYGILTFNTAWWTFSVVILMMPYLGSQDLQMASTWWVQAFIILGIPIFGFIIYRFGVPVSDVGDYIPEYQERIAQQLRVEKEIEIARESQYQLMPVNPPTGPGFDVFGFFLPSFEVGGDYFDYVLSYDEKGEPDALVMAVVDVSGKAMRAAMPAIFTSGLLLSRMKDESPEKILSEISEPVFNRTDKRTFITCVVARYDLKTGVLRVANAGHCKPVIKRNGVAEFIQTPEPRYPLGLYPQVNYEFQEFKLKKGDLFLLYSDGLPEAVNKKGERFGFEEVPRLLERIHSENFSAKEIATEVKKTIQKFSNYQLVDDTTVITLKV